MPAQPYPYLDIYKSSAITIMDGAGGATSYPLTNSAWAPAIAPLRQGEFGYGPYDDVVEEIIINVTGASAAALQSNINSLNAMLLDAERYYRTGEGSPVYIRYCPQGSTIHSIAVPLYALLLGRAEGDETQAINLPATFNEEQTRVYLQGVRVRVRRRGLWRGASEAMTLSAAAANPVYMQTSFPTTHDGPAYLSLHLTNFSASAPAATGYLLVSNDFNRLQLLSAKGMTATGFTTVNTPTEPAANNPYNTGILRYTPTGTAFATSGIQNVPNTPPSGHTWAIFATVRNNSASATWKIRPRITQGNITYLGDTTVIDASSTTPRAISLGEISVAANQTLNLSVALDVAASTASGPPTLDINAIMLVSLDDEYSRVVAVGAEGQNVTFASLDCRVYYGGLYPTVTMYNSGTGADTPISYAGDALLMHSGANIYAMWICCNSTYWRMSNGAGTVESLKIGGSRELGYLVPQ